MLIYKHPDFNTVLNPATGDEDSVAALPVTQGRVGDNLEFKVTRSYWIPSDAEMLLLSTGRYCVALTVLSHTHAPVRIDVCDAKNDIAKLHEASNDKITIQ